MNSNTINSTTLQLKSTLEKLKTGNLLPFSDVLSAQSIREKFQDIPFRNRLFSPDMTVFAFLSQVLGADRSCQAAVAQVIAHRIAQGDQPPSANTAAYCQARARLPVNLLANLAKESAQDMEAQAKPEWLWRGRSVKIADGTTLSMPDTCENQKSYPQPPSQKQGIGFPIARLVGVFSLGTGALLDLAIAPYMGKGTGEHALLRQLMSVFKPEDVLLGDAYYGSFFLIAALIQKRVDAVFPMNTNRSHDFREGKRLRKKDHLLQWKKPAQPMWMDKETYIAFPNVITVRVSTVVDTRPGYRSKTRVLVTTMLNSKTVSSEALAELYRYRWFVELNLRSMKDIMGMDILRSKTPAMVHKEIWAYVLGYNLVRKLMAQAAVMKKCNPREMSYKLAYQMLFAFRQAGIFSERDKEAYGCLLKAVNYKKVGNRGGRNEPRMVKRRPKAFPRLQKPRNFYHRVVAA